PPPPSCTGTPSSANIFAVADFPMPSEPVRPRMNMSFYPAHNLHRGGGPDFRDHALTVHELVLPQEGQQRQKRQAENRKKVALDPLEQMNPDTLELIAANTSGCRISPHVEGTIGEQIGKIA